MLENSIYDVPKLEVGDTVKLKFVGITGKIYARKDISTSGELLYEVAWDDYGVKNSLCLRESLTLVKKKNSDAN